MAGFQLQVPNGPLLEFRRGLMAWTVTADGQRVRSGRGRNYALAMPDGSTKNFRIVGFANPSVEIDGHSFPIERPLSTLELVLCGLTVVLFIPGVTGGALGGGLAVAGFYVNMLLARSFASPLARAVAIVASSAVFIALYVAIALALRAML